MNQKLTKQYFVQNDALMLAEDLLGKILVRDFGNGHLLRMRILETEAYLGSDDLGNHASKGRTKRTEVMFREGGLFMPI